MSNVFKFDPNAIRERRRLNEKTPQMSAQELEAARARREGRRAWLLFAAAVVVATILQAFFRF